MFIVKVRNDLGVKQKILSTKEILDLEPNLKPVFSGGCCYDYAYHARDPHGILIKMFELFIQKGGKFIKEDVQSLKQLNEKAKGDGVPYVPGI